MYTRLAPSQNITTSLKPSRTSRISASGTSVLLYVTDVSSGVEVSSPLLPQAVMPIHKQRPVIATYARLAKFFMVPPRLSLWDQSTVPGRCSPEAPEYISAGDHSYRSKQS